MAWTDLFEQLVIEHEALETKLGVRVVRHFPASRRQVVARRESTEIPPRSLVVAINKGGFLRRCPGSPHMACCNLHVLDIAVGCPYACSFCFLHAYQNTPGILVYANFMELRGEVENLLAERGRGGQGSPLRLTTGEVADSLALEELTGMAAELVPLFGGLDGVLLELKTKSTQIGTLLQLPHNQRVVLSWSISPSSVATCEEHGAPPVDERLDAARRAVDAGYPVAFHLDPIFLVDGWKQRYARLIDTLAERIPHASIRWFSLGGFRFPLSLKRAVIDRDPDTRIFLHEFLPGLDGKYRYFAPLRATMYRWLKSRIESRCPGVPIYLCMETAHMWRKVFGHLPGELPALDGLFGRGCGGGRPVEE